TRGRQIRSRRGVSSTPASSRRNRWSAMSRSRSRERCSLRIRRCAKSGGGPWRTIRGSRQTRRRGWISSCAAIRPGTRDSISTRSIACRAACRAEARDAMLVLSHVDLLDLLPATRIIEAVEHGVRALQAGEAAVPDRAHLHWQGTTLLTMPSGNRDFLGVKSVAVTPANAQRGLAVTSGAMLLLRADTGAPLALLNAAALTCQRTGARRPL